MNFLDYILPSLLVLIAIRILLLGGKQRTVRLRKLWRGPVFFLALMLYFLSRSSQELTAEVIGLYSLAILFGSAIGWLRGHLARLHFNPENQTLTKTSTFMEPLVLAILLLARAASVDYLTTHDGLLDIPPSAFVSALTWFTFSVIIAKQVTVIGRCIGLKRAHNRAASTTIETTETAE